MSVTYFLYNESFYLNALNLLVFSETQEAALPLRHQRHLLTPGLQQIPDHQVMLVLPKGCCRLLNQLLLIRLQLEGHHKQLGSPYRH